MTKALDVREGGMRIERLNISFLKFDPSLMVSATFSCDVV
jgi:hypothetical protein